MNESENIIRDQIGKYLEEGYEATIISDILLYAKLIELWSVKGKNICTLNDIRFVISLVPNQNENDFLLKKTERSIEESTTTIQNVETDLKSRYLDDLILELFDEQTEESSLTLLTNLLSEYMVKLGNPLANKILIDTLESMYNSEEPVTNENTERIYKDVIQMRYMEGYSTAVIKDSLYFKILLMEWLENAWPLTGEEDIDFFYREINGEPNNYMTSLTPRSVEDALVLTEKITSDLQNAEFDETFLSKIESMTKENKTLVMVEMIKEYRNKIGNKLMEETYTSLLIEVITKTSNYDDINKQ
jgi:hypothetical protein